MEPLGLTLSLIAAAASVAYLAVVRWVLGRPPSLGVQLLFVTVVVPMTAVGLILAAAGS